MSGASREYDVKLATPDLIGESYGSILARLHAVLLPKSYFEIGVLAGETLRLARCPSIGVDLNFAFNNLATVHEVIRKPVLHLFAKTSDDFFAVHSPSAILGRPIDIAFIDGLHRCEFLLRDFYNTERHCKRNSVIILHDCFPPEVGITSRSLEAARPIASHRQGWWAGDVWRAARLLKKKRPDLAITAIDAAPTGLVLITNLDPSSTILVENYQEYVTEMLTWELSESGISMYFKEMELGSASIFSTPEGITARFWL